MNTVKFPNGFTSWVRTHHEVVKHITETCQFHDTVAGYIFSKMGTPGIVKLGRTLTDEFEKSHRGAGGKFFESFEKFIAGQETKFKSQQNPTS